MLRNTSKQYIRNYQFMDSVYMHVSCSGRGGLHTVYGVGRKHDDFNVSALFRYDN